MKKHTFRRIFAFMGKHAILYSVGVLAMGILALLLQVIISTLFKEMFDAIAILDLNQMFKSVQFYIRFVVLIFIVLPVFSYIVKKTIVKTTGTIRKSLFEKLLHLPVSFFKTHHSGDTLSRLSNDTVELEKVYSDFSINFIVACVMGIGTLFYSFVLDYRLALVSLGSGLFTILINTYFAKRLRFLSLNVQNKLGKLNEKLTNLLDGIHVIRVFNLQNVILNQFHSKNDEVYHDSMERVHTQAAIDGLNDVVNILSFIGVIALGAYLSIIGVISSVGVIIAVVQLQNGIRQMVLTLGTFMTSMQGALAAGDRVFEILDEEEEPLRYLLTEGEQSSNEMVNMNHLSFGYDEKQILAQIKLKIPRGKTYAFVGPSGGGKTTLFKVILSLYEPNEGSYAINGKSLRSYTLSEIRQLMAYVPQDAYLFSGSIRENIRHGKQVATTDEVEAAAKAAFAHEFIQLMPNGYDTMVGENGTLLSGGQRQRIAIARAILKGAPLLLLDEATSALDTESEMVVQKALIELMKGKTTLVIAHRLSTVLHADQILVIDGGKVVEQGSHEELLIKKGIYAKLYETQFS